MPHSSIAPNENAAERISTQLGSLAETVDDMVRLLGEDRSAISASIEAFRVDLAALKANIEALSVNLANLAAKTEKFDRAVRGDDDGKNAGILLRLDRLEQTDQNRSKREWAIWGAILAGVVKMILDIFKP